jgi:hypothetical protein
MITICKAILSGAKPAQIREQTEGLIPGWLRDLAVKLAGDPRPDGLGDHLSGRRRRT